MPPLVPEILWLWGGLAGYSASAIAAVGGDDVLRGRDRRVLGLLGLGVALLGAAIAHRWLRVGYGPFLTLFEILLSNLFSLGLVYALAYWRCPQIRPGATVALPVLLVLGAWGATVSPAPGRLPATYDNAWLWVHVVSGKVFLGACLVALGVAGVLAGRRLLGRWRAGGAAIDDMDAAAWRWMGVAFVFHSLMLVAGAAWARDAWGRFWAWDPLETWSFVNWLAIAGVLHLRATYRVPQWLGWWAIVAVFVLAILTFLGVPFLSVAAHKGVM